MNWSSINPYCLAGPLVVIVGIVLLSAANARRTLYVSIPANVDPLDEGLDGWRGMAGRVRAERTKRALITWGIASLMILVTAALWRPAQIVYAALQPTLTPTLTSTPTLTPSPSPTPTVTISPATPTPQVIYIVITPIGGTP